MKISCYRFLYLISRSADCVLFPWNGLDRDYNMVNGEVSIEIKAAFSFYLIERLGLHAENEEIEGKRQQIILKNREEIVMKIKLLHEIESARIKELSL
ncbi:MAG: hypothetical protein ACD_35C00035G0001 [uncultured bacterium]|nr:MAG: hypothetical protein ACD_35C00035G0001 [uncultured bacterium]